MKNLYLSRTAACLFSAFFFAGQLQAEISPKYATISARNAFGLKSPEQDIVVTPQQPETKVTLNGLAKAAGQTRAYFTLAAEKPNEPSRFVNLCAGEAEGILELLSIAKESNEVRIKNAGREQILKMNDSSFRPKALPLPRR